MSFEAQAWARKIKVGTVSHKAVLMVMANCADQDGYCWPSAHYIAESTELSMRTVRYGITALENMGLIVRTRRERDNGSMQSNHYQLLLAVSSPVTVVLPEKQGGDGATTAPYGATIAPSQGGGDGATIAPYGATIAPLELPKNIKNRTLSEKSEQTLDPDDLTTAHWMFDRIKQLVPNHKPPNFNRWCNDIRLLRERGQHSHRDICALFKWANSDPFWSSNVLSPAKLREKWTQLWLKANSEAVVAGRASPALVSSDRRCHCGQAGIWSPGFGRWFCATDRDEYKRALEA